MPKPGESGIRRVIHATGYTISGLRAIWKHEAAFRQEASLAAIMIPAAFWIGTGAVQRSLLVGVCLVVLFQFQVNLRQVNVIVHIEILISVVCRIEHFDGFFKIVSRLLIVASFVVQNAHYVKQAFAFLQPV